MVNNVAAALAKVVISIFFLLLTVSGIMIGGTALHDPDTCWLLALGRWIVEHHSLPTVEPFSYTFIDLQRPLVLYQWLSETIFFCAFKIGGLVALLSLVAVLVATAFVVIPLRMFAATKTSWTVALSVISVGLFAACFHFLARPEILSYLFLSLSLFLVTTHRFKLRQSGIAATGLLVDRSKLDWRFIIAQTAIMLVWANCHTGFTSGLVVLALYLLSTTVSRAIFRSEPLLDMTVLTALLTSAAASACNPYGVNLWLYIPSLFFAKFNFMIAELKAISFKPEFVPFFILLAMFFAAYYCTLITVRENKDIRTPGCVQLAESFAVITLCLYESWTHLRLVPFAVLILTNELALLSTVKSLAGGETGSSSEKGGVLEFFDSKLAEGLHSSLKLGGIGCSVFVLLVAILGTLLTCLSIQAPILPQSGAAFHAPIRTADLVSSLPLHGNLLNDAQFGDLLVWYHPGHPKVFIDTRYDMYGEKLVQDYLTMLQAAPGWEGLLDSYKIKAVFTRPTEPLIGKLRADPKWRTAFVDADAVVLTMSEVGNSTNMERKQAAPSTSAAASPTTSPSSATSTSTAPSPSMADR